MDIPRKMKAAVLYGPEDLRVEERDVPSPDKEEVLIKVKACAICGTDPKILKEGWPFQPPYGEFIPGHEYTGEIVAVGRQVTEFKVGDRIAIETHKGCGQCVNCLRGNYTVCLNYGNKEKGHRHYGFTVNGGYAEYTVAHVNVVHKLPQNISFEEGTIATTAACVLFGVDRMGGYLAGEKVAIIGPGPIGLVAVQICKALGGERVYLTGTRDSRLSIGRKVGADVVVNVKKEDPVKIIMEETEGRGVDTVIECSGSKEAFDQGVRMLARGGRILFIGLARGPVTLEINKFILGNCTAYGVRGEGGTDCARALSLMGQGKINAKPLITHTFPLDKINQAFTTYINRLEDALKVVVIP